MQQRQVNGQLTGRNLSGTVSYNGVDGDLTGLVGGDKAIAAFHGHDSSRPQSANAGGIYATRDR
jgi:hypothetical protein